MQLQIYNTAHYIIFQLELEKKCFLKYTHPQFCMDRSLSTIGTYIYLSILSKTYFPFTHLFTVYAYLLYEALYKSENIDYSTIKQQAD